MHHPILMSLAVALTGLLAATGDEGAAPVFDYDTESQTAPLTDRPKKPSFVQEIRLSVATDVALMVKGMAEAEPGAVPEDVPRPRVFLFQRAAMGFEGERVFSARLLHFLRRRADHRGQMSEAERHLIAVCATQTTELEAVLPPGHGDLLIQALQSFYHNAWRVDDRGAIAQRRDLCATIHDLLVQRGLIPEQDFQNSRAFKRFLRREIYLGKRGN